MLIDIEKVNFVHFAGGEVHLNGDEFKSIFGENIGIDTNNTIWAPIRNSVNLMELLVLTDAYKRYFGKVPSVCIPYIPYARQDRVANEGEALTIKIFADLINAQNYPTVYVMDPHSDVSMALIDNVKILRTVDDKYLKDVIPNYSEDNYVVLAPDAGAYKRLGKSIHIPLIYATKHRDTRTGRLSNVELHLGNVTLEDKTILVVDDICDGGGTFILLKEALNNARIDNDIELYVTHGIFSKGIDELSTAYNTIYTTNSFYNGYSSYVKVHDIRRYLYEFAMV